MIDIDLIPSSDDSFGEFNFTEMLGAASKRKQRKFFQNDQDEMTTKGDGYMGQEDCLVVTVSTPKVICLKYM